MLPMPSDSACRHPHYPLRRNRIRPGNLLKDMAGTKQIEKQKSDTCQPGSEEFLRTQHWCCFPLRAQLCSIISRLILACHYKYHLPRICVCSITTTRHNMVQLWILQLFLGSNYHGKRFCYQGLWHTAWLSLST